MVFAGPILLGFNATPQTRAALARWWPTTTRVPARATRRYPRAQQRGKRTRMIFLPFALPADTGGDDEQAREQRQPPKPIGWLAWAAVAMLCLVAAVYFFGRQRDYAHQMMRMREEMRRQNIELTRSGEAFAILGAHDTLEARFGSALGQGKLYVNPRAGLLLVASGLPPAPQGKGYQVWVVPIAGKPQSAGVFQSGTGAAAWLVRPGPVDVAGTAAVTVTLEDEAGAAQPASDAVVTVQFAAR
jgi:anti-sigma-K factor RskA